MQPYQADHEDSIGQFEINWTYDDALITADRQMFYKWMVRELAQKRGMTGAADSLTATHCNTLPRTTTHCSTCCNTFAIA